MAGFVQKRVNDFAEGLKEQAEQAKKGKISWREAAQGFVAEARKFAYRLKAGGTSNDRKRAIDLVKRGMKAYNEKDYDAAESLFRRATHKDPGYGRGYAYLGNALYKQKRNIDAVTAWNKAIDVEPNSDAAEMAKEKLAHMKKPRTDGIYDLAADLVRHV